MEDTETYDVENVPESAVEEAVAQGNLPKPGDVLACECREPSEAPQLQSGDIADAEAASSPKPTALAKSETFKVRCTLYGYIFHAEVVKGRFGGWDEMMLI